MPHIMLDPGHGGHEPAGKSTAYGRRSGAQEKDLTLALAQSVKSVLGGRSQLTRSSDYNLSLGSRQARGSGADMFVSLHASHSGAPTVFVHPRANDGSRVLAGRIAAELGASVRTDTPMAVLSPEGLDGNCAACMVEADFDQLARDGVASTASAVARGVSSQLGTDTGRYGDGYFTDADQLSQMMRDERAADTLRVSTVADAQALVDAYTGRGSPTVWPHLGAATAAAEIRDRCANHRLFQQGNLNLCGPASFLAIWAGRDPVGYARYALGLLERGTASIGSNTVTATSAQRSKRYPVLGGPTRMTTPRADYLCMAPLRHDENAILPYDGSRSEALSAATTPGEVAGWLRDTGVFRSVSDEANWTRSAGIDHALRLMPGGGTDVAMLINVNALARARRVQDIPGANQTNPVTADSRFILNQFPNHFVMLLSEIVPDTGNRTLSLSAWTWAGSYVFEDIPVREFSTNYYGAVVGRVRRP